MLFMVLRAGFSIKYLNICMLGISFVCPPTIISSCFSLHLVFPYLPLLFVFYNFFLLYEQFICSPGIRVCVCHFYAICEIAGNSAPTFVYDFSNK